MLALKQKSFILRTELIKSSGVKDLQILIQLRIFGIVKMCFIRERITKELNF